MEGGGFLKQKPGFATKAIHFGQNPDQWNFGCVAPPIITTTTFKHDGPGITRGYEFARSGNPTRQVLEDCIASLDNGKYGLTFASGLGATTCISSLLSPGDHVICGDDMYGGTNRLFKTIVGGLGIDVSFVATEDASKVKAALTPKTKMVWIESPTNPLMKVTDIALIASYLKVVPNAILVVDNTFLTSYMQKPLDLGADIVMYSMTKYMNGHSDVVMGAAVTKNEELHKRLKFLQNAMGVVPSPFDCYQVNRSLKTLALRMEQHMKSALTIAKWLEKHKMVEKVLYPGLSSHPQHELSKKQTYGCSGMVSFYIKGGLKHSTEFLKTLKILILAPSLGGYQSLAELPSLMSHASIPPDERAALGLTDSLIRLSIGLEDVEDLIEDMDQALNKASKI